MATKKKNSSLFPDAVIVLSNERSGSRPKNGFKSYSTLKVKIVFPRELDFVSEMVGVTLKPQRKQLRLLLK